MKNSPKDLDRYKVKEKIGSGSYGIVYKGQDRYNGMVVALKYISKKYCINDKFQRKKTKINSRSTSIKRNAENSRP